MYAYSRATLTSNSCVCVYGEPKTRQQGAVTCVGGIDGRYVFDHRYEEPGRLTVVAGAG